MSNIPLFANQNNVDSMKEAYTAQGDALGNYDPARPAIEKGTPKDVASPYTSTTSVSGGGGTPTGGESTPDPTPAQIDTTANRPGRGPISYGQANQFLGGSADIIGASKGNIRDASAQGTELFNLFMTDAQAGGPGGAFGAEQQQALGAAVQPGRSEVQRQAGADVLNTQYTGPQDMNMGWTPADAERAPSPASQVGANLSRQQSQANALSTGFGVASQLEQAEPGMTAGERVAEARRYRTDPELQQRTREVQQTADISVENFKRQQRQAAAEAQRQQDLAQSHRVEGRAHLEEMRGGLTEPAQVEADRLNSLRAQADEAHKRYLDSGDLDALIAETPEGMLSAEVKSMAQSDAYRLPKEARQEWQNIWRSNKYSSIVDMPTMTFGASFKGDERNRMDADWVRENLVGKEGWEEISGIVESYADGRFHFANHRAAMQRYNQLKNSQGGPPPNPEEGWSETKKAAYREFEAMERLARQRDRELQERFGEGGDLQAYRPMGVLAANFGEFAGTATHPFIKAEIQEVASIANVLEPEDKERVNNITSLLNAGGQAIAEGDQYELGKIGADLMSYIEVNDLIVSDRVERMGIAASDWSSFRSGLRRMYKRAKRRRRWGIVAAIAAIVLTVVTMGAAAPTLAASASLFGTTVAFSATMLPAAMLAAQVASLAGAAHELYQAFTWEMGGDDIMSAPGVKYD